MEAGLEHLSRSGGTLAYADVLLVVMEPTRKSVMTAARTLQLAQELGIPRVHGLGNKAGAQDTEFLHEACRASGIPLAGVLPHTDAVLAADRAGEAVTAQVPDELRAELDRVISVLELSA